MTIGQSTLAGAIGIKIYNEQMVPNTSLLKQKIGVIGTYDPAKTSMVAEELMQVLNEGDAGGKFGYGWPLHRAIKAIFQENGGCEVYAIPQAEVGAAAVGSIAFSGTATSAGAIIVRESGDIIAQVPVSVGDRAADSGAAVELEVNAHREAMCTAADTTGTVALSCKAKTTWGNHIKHTVNEYEDWPGDISAVITDMSTGTLVPDIDDALAALGTGDARNAIGLTKIVHTYGLDQATIGKVSAYNGVGNDAQGLYEDVVTRPFSCWYGDVADGSAGLVAVRAIGDANKSDRNSVVISAPTSGSHPNLIAAWACGYAARINTMRAEQPYRGGILSYAHIGSDIDRWTDTHANRDLAVNSGISTTQVENGALVLKDIVTTYHPDTIAIASNGYRQARNGYITQNILGSLRSEFMGSQWSGITLVSDKGNVSNVTSRAKARDLSDVRAALLALVDSWGATAWLFDASYTQGVIAAGNAVQLRTGGNGINFNIPLIYSATFDILDGIVTFDVSLSVFFQ